MDHGTVIPASLDQFHVVACTHGIGWDYNFDSEAIFIDWFLHALIAKKDLNYFLTDLSERKYKNQKLFQKANRLIPYLERSVHEQLRNTKNENDEYLLAVKETLNEIDNLAHS